MIPVANPQAQYAALEEEIDRAVKAVLRRGDFILGSAVAELEQAVAAYCGCRRAVAVASGTDAIRLALEAAGLGPGAEVVTTPFTFVGTVHPILHAGAKPVFVDIAHDSFNLDPRLLEGAVTAATRALLPVHLFGQSADMDAVLDVAGRHGLAVIEDCAQSLGARHRDRPTGSMGACGCLSFFPTKNLGGCGDGGMIVTNDDALADLADVLRRQGSRRKYLAERLGWNSRLDTLQAAILGVKLPHLDEWIRRRRAVADRYRELLDGLPVVLPSESRGCLHTWNQFTVRTERRDALVAHLGERGIGTAVYYPTPLHLQPALAHLGHGPGDFPESERAAREVVSLPVFPELTDDDVRRVARAVREFFER